MTRNVTLAPQHLDPLFDALSPGGVTPLTDALEHAIAAARQAQMDSCQFLACLNDNGINTSNSMKVWINKKL